MGALAKKPIQIYLEPVQDKALRVLAGREGISLAALIRCTMRQRNIDIAFAFDKRFSIAGFSMAPA